jgi:ABC-2 type transport system permease protein
MAWNRRIGAVTGRVLSQLRHDRRLIGLSLIFPVVIIYFINVLFEVLANPTFNISVYVVPYGAFIVHFITFMLTTIVLVRERTSGTLTRMLVSGYRQIEVISGYLLAYSTLATFQSLVILFELNWLFELGYSAERLASIYLLMWLLAVISMALGILVSNLARNEGQVVALIPLVLLSIILSGVLIPIDRLPEWAQVLSYLTPLFYTNEAVQELLGGGVLGDAWAPVLGSLAYGLVVVGMATLTLREKD